MEPQSENSPTLLIVDDEPNNLQRLIDILEEYGFDPVIARNGEEALARARDARPDLILLDVVMPGMDGIETCKRLKGDTATRHIPVLFLSALDGLNDMLRGFAAGGVDYLIKPARQEELLARVTHQLDRGRLTAPLVQRLRSLWESDAEATAGESEQALLERHAQALERARAIVLSNLADPPQLEELARRVGINRNQLNKGFQRLYGLSVFAWLREQRLLRAARLLRETRHALAFISDSVGYSNTANFITAFKRRFAVTPQQYRACGGESAPD